VTDIDKLLRDSLNNAGDSYKPAHEVEARRTFLRRARRRRLYTGGSVAVAGAAVVALGFWLVASDFGSSAERDDETVSGIPSAHVVARTAVGKTPAGVGIWKGSVWVANSGEGSVSVIDAKSNRVTNTIQVGGTPIDVQVVRRHAWVSFQNESRLVAINIDDLSREDLDLAGGGTNLRIAPGVRSLWAVSPDTPLQRIDSATLGVTEHGITVAEPVNLTVGGGKVWVLGASGDIDKIDEAAGLDPETTLSLGAPVDATTADLAWDGTSLWVSDGGTRIIFRIDPQAGGVTSGIPFEGRFANLSTSLQAGLWAVVGDGDADASLLLIDTETGSLVPGSITLTGRPGGIVAQGGSVWTVGESSDHVFRTDLSATQPSASPEEGNRVPAERIIYVHSSSGDLTAVFGDAHVEKLMVTPEEESNPSFLSEDTIVFERTDSTGLVTVVTRNLESGEEATTPIAGEEVAIGTEERAAWVLPKDDPSEQTQIRIGLLDGSGEDFFVANPEFQPLEVRNLEWDPTGAKLYYEAGRETIGLYEVEVEDPQPRAIDPREGSATYVAPAVSESDEVIALRACCRGPDVSQTIEMGRLVMGNGPPEYSKIIGLDDAGFNTDSPDVTLEPAGTLDVEAAEDQRLWTVTSVRSWILSDGATAWIVDEEGEVDLLRPTDITGVAVNPSFLD